MVFFQLEGIGASLLWGTIGGLLYNLLKPKIKTTAKDLLHQILFFGLYTPLTIFVFVMGDFYTLRSYMVFGIFAGFIHCHFVLTKAVFFGKMILNRRDDNGK